MTEPNAMPDPMAQWPDLPLAAWSETCDTLQLWTQIVGKLRIALTPLVNHWWNATFSVTARGLVAPAMPYRERTFDVVFDFTKHRLDIEASDGRVERFDLKPMAVAGFYAVFMQALRRLGIDTHIRTMPCEIENAVPFDQDRTHAQYDAAYAQKFWLALVQANRVMNEFRSRFIGKASPVHFFWGSFDLAVTKLRTAGAFYDKNLGQFILPYDAVRQARDPDTLLLGFLQETYAAAADLAHWDRKALERG